MMRSFLCLLALLFAATPARAGTHPMCQGESEARVRQLDAFLEHGLTEHARYAFTRDLKTDFKRRAKDFLDQRLLDKRAEVCASRLKLAEEIRVRGGCPAELVDAYVREVAVTYEQNKRTLEQLRQEHVKALQKKLFEIASGSTQGLEGVTYKGYALVGAPKELKFEWLKLVAGQLGEEIHKTWGAVEADRNPLASANADFAREAVSAKREADNARRTGCGRAAASAQ